MQATQKRYIDGVQQAKLIRAALKTAFPEVKFSVRKDGANCIRVNWTDGPASVEDVISRFRGGGFDGQTDSSYYVDQELDGETVSYACSYVFAAREISPEFHSDAVAAISEAYGQPLPTDWNAIHAVGRIPVHVTREGRVLRMVEGDVEYLQDLIHRYTATHARDAS